MIEVLEAREPGAKYLTQPKSPLDRGFDLAASASNGVAALRELVLAAALRGRLDDPGRPLLASSMVDTSPEPHLLRRFPLPKGWRWRTVGELCALRTGATPSTSRREYYDGGVVKWLVSGDIHSREIVDCEGRITEFAMSNANCKLLPANSVLIALNGQGKTRATVAILRVAATCNQSLVAMTPRSDSGVTPEFLFWNLRYRYREIRDITGQKQRRGLNMGLVSELSVAVPPMEEQPQIVARVDELMRLCDALEEKGRLEAEQHGRLLSILLGTLTDSATGEELASNWQRVADHFDLLLDRPEAVEALEQTILQLAVRGLLVPQDPGDEPGYLLASRLRARRGALLACPAVEEAPHELPPTWAWIRFDELIEPDRPISYGVLVPGPDVPNGVPFVRIADLSLTDPAVLPEKRIGQAIDAQYQRTRLEGGEILMGVVGSIGKLGMAPASWAGANIARAICRIVPVYEVDREFVLLLLQSGFMQASFAGDTRTLAQPTLNVGLIRNSPTPLPPRAEQARIVARVTELRRVCTDLRERLTAARDTQSRLADALVADATA